VIQAVGVNLADAAALAGGDYAFAMAPAQRRGRELKLAATVGARTGCLRRAFQPRVRHSIWKTRPSLSQSASLPGWVRSFVWPFKNPIGGGVKGPCVSFPV